MAERKFTKGLGKPGMAAQVRENVSQAVKATAIQQARSRLVEPLDYEEYLVKNKVLLSNDPVRDMLLVPPDTVKLSILPRECRTLQCLASVVLNSDVCSPLVRQCLNTYCTSHSFVTFKDGAYSGSFLQLPTLPKVEDLKEQVYEVDTDIEQQADTTELTNADNIIKKGYLLKGPDSANDKLFSNFSSKTFKRRFACLRQQMDGSHILEFHKDERKQDAKSTILLQFCTAVNKNPVRGACCFELQQSAEGGGRIIILSAESEADMIEWTEKINRILHASKSTHVIDKGSVSPQYGTLRSLQQQQQALKPHLIKVAQENSFTRQQGRLGARTNLFNCCSDLKRDADLSCCIEYTDDSNVLPVKQDFGVRFRVTCESLKFRLQAPVDPGVDGAPLTQLEPYITHLALYDVAAGIKVSEDFHFDLNSPMARSLLFGSSSGASMRDRLGSSSSSGKSMRLTMSSDDSDGPVPVPLSLAGVPEEWLAYPKQCVCSVVSPNSSLFLVVMIQKVLQGSVSGAVEPYVKHHHDAKSIIRLQKTIKTCCSRLGEYRMPFGWSARQIFRSDGKLDPNTDFSPIYKFDEKKMGESEMIKLLQDLKKGDKLSKLTVIPGTLNINISPMEVTTPNSLTPSLEPVVPFPNPPTHEPTIEVQEFSTDNLDITQPYTTYVNHLYVYPRHLNYDNQKIFGRARNIVCCIEVRDSDSEGSLPLKVIYTRACQGLSATAGVSSTLTTYATTLVLHHNTFPEWTDEIKIALPHTLTAQHHLLFTFSHIAIEGAKAGKKEEPVEIVGYAWFPLLSKGRINTDDQVLPVAAHLPSKYLSIEPLGLGRGFSGPEVRWVDSQKNVFRMSSRLVSSIVSSDQHLHNFFQSTSGLLTPPQTPIATSGSTAANPFANAFTSAMSSTSVGSASNASTSCENSLAGDGLVGAYRKRTESGGSGSDGSRAQVAGELTVTASNSTSAAAPAGIDTLSAISAISAISPAISTPKSSRSSSVSTLVGSGSIKTGPTDAETVRILKSLGGVSTATVIRFLPSVLNRLLSVLVVSGQEVGCSTLSVLVELFTRLHLSNRLQLLQSYIKYDVHIDKRALSSPTNTLHENLCRALATVLRPPVSDQAICEAAMQQMTPLLDLVIRSIAMHLITSNRIKMDRRERFSSSLNRWVRSVVESLTHHITQNSKQPYARTANSALAHFIKRLLSLMDRGFVYSLVKVYLEAFSPGDRVGLQLLKLSFLRIVSSHPHYVQLNLPVFDTANINTDGKQLRLTCTDEYQLSAGFVSRHYLVGAVLGAVASSLGEVAEVQRAGVSLLRDLLTKHSFDDRYSQENQQGRIACLYMPLLGLLLDNISRLTWPSLKHSERSSERAKTPAPAAPPVTSSCVKRPDVRSSTRSSKTSRVTYASSVDGLPSSQQQTPNRASTPSLRLDSAPSTPRPVSATHALLSHNPSLLSHASSASHRSEASYLSLIAGPGGFSGGYGILGGVGDLLTRGGNTSAGGLAVLLSPGRSSTTSLESEEPTPSVAASETTLEEESEEKEETCSSKGHGRQLSVSFAGEAGEVKRYDKLRPTRDLLLCLLQVLRHVPQHHMVSYWNTLSNDVLLDFLTLIHLCLEHFRYIGKQSLSYQLQQSAISGSSQSQQMRARKSSTLPTKLQPPYFDKTNGNTDTYPGPTGSISYSGSGVSWQRAVQEANLATQAGLICLDVLSTLLTRCSERLMQPKSAPVLNKAVGLHLIMLQLGQSETLLKHIFAALRGFMTTFPDSLFQGEASLCGWMCFELLKCCNSKLSSVRHDASIVLYLLMRANYQHSKTINRVHLQVIISVSQLQGEVRGLNNSRFQESMALVNSYAHADNSMENTGLMGEVSDLTTRVRTVLVATAKMEHHSKDPEMLCSLQHSLAASYAATPQLRITWLNSMTKLHLNNNNLSEAALCEIHIAAVMAEYLRGEGLYSEGCQPFSIISPNILRDETNIRTDHAANLVDWQGGHGDTVYTLDSLITQLECCALMLDRAERYEQLGNLYRLLIPIYEQRRNYPALIHCYSHLYQAYTRVVEVNSSQKRLLGRYFRVAFYGVLFFEEEAGKEYVYKEPKVTSLAEVSERLYHQYCDKFGKENVKMIMDSNAVDLEELDPKLAYIQVTHVTPYFTEEEQPNRQTEYERNNNINQFVFETPFTKVIESEVEQELDGGLDTPRPAKPKPKAHGRLQDQWKRRVVVSTSYTFPYVQKRIPIVDTQVQEMSPIEVAIDEMESRVKELAEIINKTPTDIKKLQLKLQGSISVQVNAGPLAYATTFLQPDSSMGVASSPDTISLASNVSSSSTYPVNQVSRLREVYKQFMVTCKLALELNAQLISSDQCEYQMALESTYAELLSALENVLGSNILSEGRRSSAAFLNMLTQGTADC